jgi:hypothetical protein
MVYVEIPIWKADIAGQDDINRSTTTIASHLSRKPNPLDKYQFPSPEAEMNEKIPPTENLDFHSVQNVPDIYIPT